MEKGEVAQNEQFWFIPQCFHAICTLKSFNSHISVVVCNFFEFGTVSKCNACHGAAARSLLLQYGWYPEINRILKAHTKSLHRLCTISKYGIVWILRLSGFGHNMNFWLVPFNILTHYQTTNFRLFQTERVCGRQFQIWRKWQQVIQTGRKHCGKTRNCSLQAISPFSHIVFKRLVSQVPQKVSLCGNGLRHLTDSLPNDKILDWSKLKAFADDKITDLKIKICFGKSRKHCCKRGKFWLPAFSPFPTIFRVVKSRDCLVRS